MTVKYKRALIDYYARVAMTPSAPTPAQTVPKKKLKFNNPAPTPKRKRRAKWRLLQVQQPKIYMGVGIINILPQLKPRLPADKAWARAVPRQLRRPGRVK